RPMRIDNTRTRRPNFLREAQFESHFCTVLSVQDPAGTFHHLLSFYWNVHWEARFLPGDFADLTRPWAVTRMGGALGNGVRFSRVIPGTPNDPRVTPFLTAPIAGGTNCNVLLDNALAAPNRLDSRIW